jgi:geranylgeranyl pyrophosphate synthase
VGDLYDSISEFVLRGGKRIASFSTLLVCRGYDFHDTRSLAAVCEGLEFYRHSILVHDDLVDDDALRRGSPTLHRKYSDRRDSRLGIGAAVLAGNIMFCLGIDRVLDSGLLPQTANRVVGEIIEANQRVNESQSLDLLMEGTEADLGTWQAMASKRAASLFSATMRVGGIMSGAQADLDALGDAGAEMGYVFDIQDDIIDTFASREDYGRNVGSDLKTLKRPLHVVLALQRATEEEKAVFYSPSSDLERVKEIMTRTGAVEEAKAIAEEHAGRALALIQATGMRPETKGLFEALMAYMGKSLRWYA